MFHDYKMCGLCRSELNYSGHNAQGLGSTPPSSSWILFFLFVIVKTCFLFFSIYVSTKHSLACGYVVHLWRSYLWIIKIVVKSITNCNCLPIPLLLNVAYATQALTKTLVSPTTLIIYHWISPPIFNNSHTQLDFFASHKYVIASGTYFEFF
jgi:hypothetical protein